MMKASYKKYEIVEFEKFTDLNNVVKSGSSTVWSTTLIKYYVIKPYDWEDTEGSGQSVTNIFCEEDY